MKLQKRENIKRWENKMKSLFKKNKERGSSKSSQVECFNYGGKWHFIINYLLLKR